MPRGAIDYNRLQQADLTVVAMQIALEHGGAIQTAHLKDLMVQKYRPQGADAQLNANWQENFRQVVGNIISNRRRMQTSMFNLRYADKIRGGFRLTQLGRDFLETVPT
ncbi:hypothetical protein [Brevundimonas mediterranea]|uniref:Restriction system protein Mrr-like N-terminal domain-containing protein n=1 Tax=Brevundimonas mediterranea TaxID=74329 RepID=A0A7W6A238_9CAUL|nr:hypothetical protein [Brevundimonas mediterranea]MBB3870515.1 hypothetical protein [Brevundimonas mediterranea]